MVLRRQKKHYTSRTPVTLITLWGDANSPLHEYSNRQWSGLLNDFYKPRWQQFFALLQQSLRTGAEPDLKQFATTIKEWEWKWVKTQKAFPVTPIGNEIQISIEMHKKYRKEVE